MFDIVSIGAATVDILVKSDQIKIDSNIISLPRSSKNEITQYSFCSGGGATNSSVSFSRLGLNAACVVQIGKDPISQYIRADLEVDKVTGLLVGSDSPTDFSVILVASDGSRSILTNRGPESLEEKDINWEKLVGAKWVYVTSLEGNLDLLEKIVGFAFDNHLKVALNPGTRELTSKKRLQSLLEFIDFLLLNRSEAEMFTEINTSIEDILDCLSKCGCRQSAVTNGREGAHIVVGDQRYYSPIINTNPVDETGAGDSFGSAYVSAIIHGLSPSEALFWGVKNSASVVSALGAKAGLLTYDQIVK